MSHKKKMNEQLLEAARTGDLEKLQQHLNDGADVNAQDDDTWGAGLSALHEAIIGKHLKIVEWLLNEGANPELENNTGERALHIAAQEKQEKIIILLLKYGAEVSASDDYGWTAINYILSSTMPDEESIPNNNNRNHPKLKKIITLLENHIPKEEKIHRKKILSQKELHKRAIEKALNPQKDIPLKKPLTFKRKI